MAALPLILAGPIVRRVTARSVSIWIAVSASATVTLAIWDKVVATGSGDGLFVPVDPPLHSVSRTTIRVGEKLHVAVATIDLPPAPAAPLFPGKLYSYHMSFTTASGSSDLKSLGLLVDKFATPDDPVPNLALGYMPRILPSFVLPPVAIDKLNVVHGSCRKAHGPGMDVLAALDGMIRKAVNDNEPDERPHQLFLTGDQIYADEIPIVLLPAINQLGHELLGMTEKLSAKRKDGVTATFEDTMANFPATRRHRLVVRNANFSTQEGANHLLSFGEFAATYLMCLNNAVWPKELYGSYDDLKGNEDFLATWNTDPLTALEQDLAPLDAEEQKKHAEETAQQKAARIARTKEDLQDLYKKELKEVITFRAQLPKVRRALANVPVYMIMDDHEVTDDWYITKDWRDRVLTAPLGVNIIRNALVAYALFQDWGNNPSSYATGSKADLLSKLPQLFPGGAASGPVQATADVLDVLFGFDLSDETAPPLLWHYSVPSSETTTYVLDTRTRRTYETRRGCPGLLSKSAMDDQIPLDPQPEKFLVFVSPAPVLGLATLEELLQPAMTVFNQYDADPEAWALSPPAFEELLKRLQIFKRVVLLSGDVHFGLTGVLDYWKKGAAQPARMVQFVSSALKNQKFKNEHFLLGALVQKILGSLFYPGERLGWDHRAGLQVSNPGGQANLPRNRIRLRKEPVLLPTRGWPAGSSANQPADWSWRLTVVPDKRPDDNTSGARPENIQVRSISPDVNPSAGDATADYRKVLARHAEFFKKNAGRVVGWDNNIGLIKFTTDGAGNTTVSQQLRYWLPADELDDEPDAYTVSAVRLEPAAGPIPSIT